MAMVTPPVLTKRPVSLSLARSFQVCFYPGTGKGSCLYSGDGSDCGMGLGKRAGGGDEFYSRRLDARENTYRTPPEEPFGLTGKSTFPN